MTSKRFEALKRIVNCSEAPYLQQYERKHFTSNAASSRSCLIEDFVPAINVQMRRQTSPDTTSSFGESILGWYGLGGH